MSQMFIDFEKIDVVEAKKEYSKLMSTFKKSLMLSDEHAAIAVSIAIGACPYCWERPRGCQCWNDE